MAVRIKAPLMGTLACWLVEEGAVVEPGDVIAEIELMKTFHSIVAERAGILRYKADLGEILNEGDTVAEIEG